MNDALEALVNAAVGLAVSWIATVWVLGFSPGESVAITAMFFGLSTARSYTLRRIFRRLER